ncbi:MAG: PcfB family protein [Lachnospiraceae bacterium]|nr:PcfB family protein [Lachnospiraceae bacterium]
MQDEVNQRVVALSVRVATKGGKMTADVLKAAMRKWLKGHEQKKSIKFQQKMKKATEPKHGKQTVGTLMEQNQGLTNIEITDQNIKSFERVANKYNIDFALTKDKASEVPKYVVFFKARDVDVMTAAFKEYSVRTLERSKRPSLKKKLAQAVAKSKQKAQQKSQQHNKDRQRQKNRGQDR